MSDALPDLRQPLTDDERTRAACDWSDYRKDYGVSADPAVRALEHAAFISGWTARHQETQSAYKDETLAALALATVNSEDRAAEAAATIATQAEEIRHLEADERIAAWHRLAEHPALASCYDQERPLIDAVMDRLDELARLAAEVVRLALIVQDKSVLIERNGVRYCLCSRADRMNDRAQAHCPHHGHGMHHQRDAERARADRLEAVVTAVREIRDRHRGQPSIISRVMIADALTYALGEGEA